MRKPSLSSVPGHKWQISRHEKSLKSLSLVALMLLSVFASIQFISLDARATTDQDGDGLTYGLEFLLNLQPSDPDSDNDGLPDGWEWKYGLDPLSSSNDDGAVGDPDGDGMSNLQEYTYLMPNAWDLSSTPTILDNGVWWNGTVPVNNWDEENSMQYNRPACGSSGADGNGNIILCDEDPVGNICANGFDDDKDGLVDAADPDGDGDADCNSDDDDGDGIADEDVAGWDTDGDGMPDGWEAANNLNATSASNIDGPNGDPDGDGLINILEYVNPSWNTMCGAIPCFRNGPNGAVTETTTPCDPLQGCLTLTAEVDGITSTNPQRADSDNDGLNDSYEALTLLTDPTASDTDNDGIPDGVEVNGLYGNPPQPTDPRDNNTDDDELDDGEEDNNSNGQIDPGETDPTRKEDSGDEDEDGLQNWEENMSCTLWDVADSDFGGVNDGEEFNATHSTDPCNSFINFKTQIVGINGNLLDLSDISGFNPSGGIGWYNNSGTLAPFTYLGISGQFLLGVSPLPSVGITEVVNRNGSFCHTAAFAAGTLGTTQQHCDDDYIDNDGDGLADWEELLGTYGYFSNPSMVDTDSDGVSDFDEVFQFTDPNQPCDNLLDDDSDNLNNYFETSIGCDLSWIGIFNGSQDAFVTNTQVFDTDSGGVGDRTEYFDGTNPQNNPLDDVLPDDFDGDGIPDAIENTSGTDWTNPDTDGGGMLDGDECPSGFWATGCVGSGFNPLDPTDDIISQGVVFWANNSSGNVDLNQTHRWSQNTFDFYTGTTYAHISTVHPFEELLPLFTNTTNLPDDSFSNGSVDWFINFNSSITRGNVPISAKFYNVTFWSDPSTNLSRSNDTHTVKLSSQSLIESISLQQNEYYFDWDTIAVNTIAGRNFSYESDYKSEFDDLSNPLSLVSNITSEVISAETDSYSTALALSEFLKEGNASIDFKRFHDAPNINTGDDIAKFILENNYGRCNDYNAAFVTMARIAGLPARYVTGYSGGDWNGNGYTVSTNHQSSWGEVRLELDTGTSILDLGWIPFDSCPEAEELEIVNQSLSPLTWDRNMSQNITLDGQFRYVENTTSISDIELKAYLIPIEDIDNVPGPGITASRLIGSVITSADGNFTFNGTPVEPNLPGLHVIAVVYQSSGFIASNAIFYSNLINVTDDSILNHTTPLAINSPIAGAGSTTIIQGDLNLENSPEGFTDKFGNQLVWLSFVSSFNGSNNLSGLVSPSGAWSVTLELDITESIALLPATLWYEGWVDDFSVPSNPTPQYHIRPSSLNLNLDVREAPNLTATISSSQSNDSIFIVGQDLWVNGTAVTAGDSSIDMEGDLILSMRENGSFNTWIQIFNVSVNGTFSVQQNLSASLANTPAGEIEFQLRFYPNSIDATDDANLSSNIPRILKSFLLFQFETNPVLRGTFALYTVKIADHRDVLLNFIEGDFDLKFNGTWFNTTVNSSGILVATLILDANLVATDYDLEIIFNGSKYYETSNGFGTLRVKGGIGWTFTLGQEWTHIGNSTYINGTIFDEIYNTAIIDQNITQYSISLQTEEGDTIDIAQGVVNNSTSSFSQPFTIPTNIPSNGYNLIFEFDFYSFAPDGGPYFASGEVILDPITSNMTEQPIPSVLIGVESEFILSANTDKEIPNIVLTNDRFNFNVSVNDVADKSVVSDTTVEFIFDWNGTNQTIGTSVSDSNGTAVLQWDALGISPGQYEVLMIVYDDLTSPLDIGNSRRIGNSTIVELTVKGNSDIRIDSIPSTITAGLDFNVFGQVIDSDDPTRQLISSVKLEAHWLDNPNETLVTSYSTTSNGTFNMTVPTDTSNNGTVRGARTLVISVVEDSSPFYVESSVDSSVFIFGVSGFDSLRPLNPIIVNRGQDVNLSGQLVEASNRFQPLSSYDVAIQLGDVWISNLQTNGTGSFDLTYNIPLTNPLGLVTATFWFNGSSDLLSTKSNLSTIIIRSDTFLIIDQITDNPIAGESFNISGNVISDNGSGLEQSDGTLLPANILFSIDDQLNGFTVTGGAVRNGGLWNATILLGNGFEAGTHLVEATYIPTVNFYLGSNDTEQFESRGFSQLFFMEPSIDSLGQPTLNDRTERGSDITIEVLLQDNTGAPIEGQQVIVSFSGTSITTTITTLTNGSAFGVLSIPSNQSVGPMVVDAIFSGTPGTTGIIGSETNSTFIVLAQTNLSITEYPDSLVAGDYMLLNGTLLDDLSMPLKDFGIPSSAVVHLLVDGVPVASIETDAINGTFTLGWAVPEDISAGVHDIEVQFYGGRDWVDPIGVGEPSNPEYYLPSSDTVNFNVSVPTVISLLTQSGDVNREEVMVIEGMLVDVVNNPLVNLTVEVWLDGVFMTNVETDSTGFFTAIYPVPADAELGPVLLEVRFTGTTFYLPSGANSTWNIFSHILVSVDMPSIIAVGQNILITGSVVDNQLIAIPNHSIDLVIEGIIISSVTTDSNGDFIFDWTVPDIFEFGNHTLVAFSESQGYYRANSSNTTFFLAHRSDLTLLFDEGSEVTRGEIWLLSGRLFDFDSFTKEGLEGETIRILLDGNEVATTTTGNNGEWDLIVPATLDLARGMHSFEVIFEGTNSHLESNISSSAYVWSDVVITIDQSSTSIAIRSDGTYGPIELTGSISELGGSGEIFENITLYVGNGSDCVNEREGARCISSSMVNLQWSNGNYTISTIAPSWYQFGEQYIHLDMSSNSSLYLNGASVSHPIFIQLNVDFVWEIEEVIPNEKEDITGSIRITANDTDAGVPGIAVTFILTNSSQGEVTSPLTITTNSNGVAIFEFNSDPPFGDEDSWGELNLDVQINDPIISSTSKEQFEILRSESSFDPSYQSIEDTSGQSLWIYLVVLLISALIAGGVVIYRRRLSDELLQDAAEVFAYTAELLAAGDSIRETIFTCYQNLCSVLQQNGFLRRDFETVREFEVAIRQAMPEISDDALLALDNMFEMARYSREELGPQHQAAAQQALERMSQEIGSLALIPNR